MKTSSVLQRAIACAWLACVPMAASYAADVPAKDLTHNQVVELITAGRSGDLGIRDVAALAEAVVDARRLGLDIGGPDVLARYQRWRRFDTLEMTLLTDGLGQYEGSVFGLTGDDLTRWGPAIPPRSARTPESCSAPASFRGCGCGAGFAWPVLRRCWRRWRWLRRGAAGVPRSC